MLRSTQCDSGGSKTQYDPQVGQAAAANTAIAQQAQQFSQDYTEKYITPALLQAQQESSLATADQHAISQVQLDQMNTANDQYKTYGLPAESKYYKMVQDYSDPAEQTRQANLALGDIRTTEGGQNQTMLRRLGALGVNPSSPAAISAMSDINVQNAATEAAAQTRARSAAKTLGMQLQGDAVNVGRGDQSAITNFGAGASGAAAAGANIANSSVGVANSGAGVTQTGQGLGLKAYGNNLDAYSGLAKADMQYQAQGQSGFGSFLGTVAKTALPFVLHSDRRMKKNIRKLAKLSNGLNLYSFDYLTDHDGTNRTGLMADEVERINPAAVMVDPVTGYKMVDYSRALA